MIFTCRFFFFFDSDWLPRWWREEILNKVVVLDYHFFLFPQIFIFLEEREQPLVFGRLVVVEHYSV
jgi:hypothetical protein